MKKTLIKTKISEPDRSKFSKWELAFAELWDEYYPNIDLYFNYTFIPPRRFRFDFASIDSKVAIEINGGNWIRGRHTRASNLSNEYEKLNLATLNGWRVFVLSPEMINEDWLARIASCIKN
jgi:hypothetical protein